MDIKDILSSEYVLGVLAIAFVVCLPALKVLLTKLVVAIKLRTPDSVDGLIDLAASYGAQYAEQLGRTMTLLGEEKMDLAIAAAARRLSRYGIDVDEDELRERIEASLSQLRRELVTAVGRLGFGEAE